MRFVLMEISGFGLFLAAQKTLWACWEWIESQNQIK